MNTVKNCHSPSGMGFNISSVQHVTEQDCPKCKYGTIRFLASYAECIDCKTTFPLAIFSKSKKGKP